MRLIEQYLLDKIKKDKCIHLGLIDPEKTGSSEAAWIAKTLEQYGSTAVMIGGSTVASNTLVDDIVKSIKKNVKIPVILFPSNNSGVSKFADALWFMSLLNSNNTMFITGFQALAAPTIKYYGLEAISLAYIIIGEGSTAAYIGQAHSIPYESVEIATSYALAAEYLGMHFVYLEAGSGAKQPVSPKMVSKIKASISIPVVVGGGIRGKIEARSLVKAGADAIVTGTVVEDDKSLKNVKEIIEEIHSIRCNRTLRLIRRKRIPARPPGLLRPDENADERQGRAGVYGLPRGIPGSLAPGGREKRRGLPAPVIPPRGRRRGCSSTK